MATVDDLAGLDPELRYELINGTPHILTLTAMHQHLRGTITTALQPPRGDTAGFLPLEGMSLEVDPHNQPLADIVITPARHLRRSTLPAQDLLLVAEVLWPDSAARDRGEKAEIYARSGIPAYWIIDPTGERITLTAYRLGACGYRTIFEGDGIFHSEWPWPSTIDLPAMTARYERIPRPTA